MGTPTAPSRPQCSGRGHVWLLTRNQGYLMRNSYCPFPGPYSAGEAMSACSTGNQGWGTTTAPSRSQCSKRGHVCPLTRNHGYIMGHSYCFLPASMWQKRSCLPANLESGIYDGALQLPHPGLNVVGEAMSGHSLGIRDI